MIFGTDLAIERREITNSGKNDGVTVKKRRVKSASVTEIEITTDAGAEKLGKPVGIYVTVELPPFSSEFDDADSRMFAEKCKPYYLKVSEWANKKFVSTFCSCGERKE